MDDRLEKFIKSHRADMDDRDPRKELWKGIEDELELGQKQKRISNTFIIWRAAAVILLVVTTWLVFDKLNQDRGNQAETEIAKSERNLFEAESFYISLIDEKRESIRAMSEKYDLGDDFIIEIDKLDSAYMLLKRDMQQGNEANLIDAMILNLQLRIELLNQQLNIIQSIENKRKDEKVIL